MYEALSEKVAWLFIQFFVFFALIKAISAMVSSLVSSLKTMMELALYGYPIVWIPHRTDRSTSTILPACCLIEKCYRHVCGL